jgi:hypothetical protein
MQALGLHEFDRASRLRVAVGQARREKPGRERDRADRRGVAQIAEDRDQDGRASG